MRGGYYVGFFSSIGMLTKDFIPKVWWYERSHGASGRAAAVTAAFAAFTMYLETSFHLNPFCFFALPPSLRLPSVITFLHHQLCLTYTSFCPPLQVETVYCLHNFKGSRPGWLSHCSHEHTSLAALTSLSPPPPGPRPCTTCTTSRGRAPAACSIAFLP